MPAKPNPDLLLAQTLAAPFTPRSQGIPLSYRGLPDGGMVVITADGRKLWFSAAEVAAVRTSLLESAKQQAHAAAAARKAKPIKLAKGTESEPRAHNGMPLRAAISKDLKL